MDESLLYSPVSINELKKDIHSPDQMRRICESSATTLKTSIAPDKLLKTIASLESSFGQDCRMRFEPAYYPSGIYYQKSSLLKNAWDLWGALISFSYGPFQIMYCKALELGFPMTKNPLFLWDGNFSAPYVCELINDLSSRGVKSLEEILACYNGGLLALKKPQKSTIQYIQKGVSIFNNLK